MYNICVDAIQISSYMLECGPKGSRTNRTDRTDRTPHIELNTEKYLSQK